MIQEKFPLHASPIFRNIPSDIVSLAQISHPSIIHSAKIGDYTVHPAATIVANPLLQEWDPRSLASNQSI